MWLLWIVYFLTLHSQHRQTSPTCLVLPAVVARWWRWSALVVAKVEKTVQSRSVSVPRRAGHGSCSAKFCRKFPRARHLAAFRRKMRWVVRTRASNDESVSTIMEKAPTRTLDSFSAIPAYFQIMRREFCVFSRVVGWYHCTVKQIGGP